MAVTKLIPAIRKLGYKNKSGIKLLKELRASDFEIEGTLTVERVRMAVAKIKAKDDEPDATKPSKSGIKKRTMETSKKPSKERRREEGVKVKKQKLPKKKPFKYNEVTFGKTTTPGYEFVSNMFPTAIYCLVNGEYIMFYCVEQAFQYMKTTSKSHREKIRNCIKAKDAKYHGSERAGCPMKEDWLDLREKVMYEILKAKYSQNAVMAEKLLDTGDVPIIEIAPWDKEGFWGVDEERQGKNRSGKLTEKVRTWLRKRKGNKEFVGYYSAVLDD